MNLSLPSSLKGALTAIGVLMLLGVAAAAVTMIAAMGADTVGAPSIGALIRKYSPFRFA